VCGVHVHVHVLSIYSTVQDSGLWAGELLRFWSGLDWGFVCGVHVHVHVLSIHSTVQDRGLWAGELLRFWSGLDWGFVCGLRRPAGDAVDGLTGWTGWKTKASLFVFLEMYGCRHRIGT
jgi:hypothetical protein